MASWTGSTEEPTDPDSASEDHGTAEFVRVLRVAASVVIALVTGVATYLAGVTPKMHDYWNADEEERSSQKIAFVKNLSLFGAALVFLREARK